MASISVLWIMLFVFVWGCSSFQRATYRLNCGSSMKQLHSSSALWLNRILFERNELQLSDEAAEVMLPAKDPRCQHITRILQLKEGDLLRCGVVDVGMMESAVIRKLSTLDGTMTISFGDLNALYQHPDQLPPVDLILAVPRPLRLERLLPVISCLGVGRLCLVGGDKVEKSYFGSHLFRRPEEMRRLLVEGLSQAEVDCRVPEVYICKNLKKFLLNDSEPGMLRTLYGTSSEVLKLIAHPPLNYTLAVSGQALHQERFASQSDKASNIRSEEDIDYFYTSHRFGDFIQKLIADSSTKSLHSRVLVAIGPEGGWTQPELKLFHAAEFAAVHVGERILRTDIAVPVLLGLAHDAIAQIKR